MAWTKPLLQQKLSRSQTKSYSSISPFAPHANFSMMIGGSLLPVLDSLTHHNVSLAFNRSTFSPLIKDYLYLSLICPCSLDVTHCLVSQPLKCYFILSNPSNPPALGYSNECRSVLFIITGGLPDPHFISNTSCTFF